MPRPEKPRIVEQPPLIASFKPRGIAKKHLTPVHLSLDEYEALRLSDYLGLDHHQAAQQMTISRSTFTRLIERARRALTAFLIEGRELIIEGGKIHFRTTILRCLDCGEVFNQDLENTADTCPRCESPEIQDIAGAFGHGGCCQTYLSQFRG